MNPTTAGIAAKSSIIICLVGFPGAGKLTIARALAPSIDATIVDSHEAAARILDHVRQLRP